MAKAVKTAKAKEPGKFFIGRKNINIFLIGLITIAIGFILMAQPPVNGFLSRTLAPIVLVIAYLVIFPIAILKKDGSDTSGTNN